MTTNLFEAQPTEDSKAGAIEVDENVAANTWEECYRNNLKRMFDLEEEARGSDDDFRKLRDTILNKAVARLLRPLETEGRSIKPCLVHGDLWR
ncbi:MAG: hypothetical protein Q9222_005694 [Ikaeria aurantiellina]